MYIIETGAFLGHSLGAEDGCEIIYHVFLAWLNGLNVFKSNVLSCTKLNCVVPSRLPRGTTYQIVITDCI